MQSTVFDFSFRLKRTEDNFYILPSAYNILSFDFKTYLIKEMSHDFSMASSFRANNDNTIEYVDFDEYCESVEDTSCKSRYYTGGIYGYMSIFALQADEGFIGTPEFLLRDSHYEDAIMGRFFSGGLLLHNQQRYLVRKGEFLSIINPTHEAIYSKLENTFGIEPDINYSMHITAKSEPWNVATELMSAKILTGNNYYLKIIENTIKREKLLFYEKANLNGITVEDMSITIHADRIDLNDAYMGTDITLELVFSLANELNEFVAKYAIMSINRNIVDSIPFRSNPSRITVNKGEF